MWPQVSGLSSVSERHRIIKQSGEAGGRKCAVELPAWLSTAGEEGPVSLLYSCRAALTYLQEHCLQQMCKENRRFKNKLQEIFLKSFFALCFS